MILKPIAFAGMLIGCLILMGAAPTTMPFDGSSDGAADDLKNVRAETAKLTAAKAARESEIRAAVSTSDEFKKISAAVADIEHQLESARDSRDSARVSQLATNKLELTRKLNRMTDAPMQQDRALAEIAARLRSVKAKGDEIQAAEANKKALAAEAVRRRKLLEIAYDRFKDESRISTTVCRIATEAGGGGLVAFSCSFSGTQPRPRDAEDQIAMVFVQDGLSPNFKDAHQFRFLVDGERTSVAILTKETSLGPNGLGVREVVGTRMPFSLLQSILRSHKAEFQVGDVNYKLDSWILERIKALVEEIEAGGNGNGPTTAPSPKDAKTSGLDV